MNKFFVILFISLICVSCSSLPKINSDHDNSYDLSGYKSYKIESPNLKDTPSQISLNPILIQRFKRAINSSLQNRGFFESSNPDMVIRFYLGTWREVDRSFSNDGDSYGVYGRRYFNSDQKFYRVDRDGISIRFHDKSSDEVFWYAFSRFNRSSSISDQTSVNLFIERVLSEFD